MIFCASKEVLVKVLIKGVRLALLLHYGWLTGLTLTRRPSIWGVSPALISLGGAGASRNPHMCGWATASQAGCWCEHPRYRPDLDG
jgi:hypothetical protein